MVPAELENEAALVRLTKTGCTESFQVLVNRYKLRIYRLSYFITRNAEDAEDVSQETFLKAYAGIRSFREESCLYSWLFRIARNEALSKLRRRQASAWVSLDEPAYSGEADSAPIDIKDGRSDPEESYSRNELRAIVFEALEDLPTPLRVVFALRYLEGFSGEETARILGLSLFTVKCRSLYARRRLQRKLRFRFREPFRCRRRIT